MPTTTWNVTGQYYETCSCDFVCPCILTQMSATPTGGACTFAMAFAIDRGSYDSLTLDGLGFVVLGLTPEAMGKGNWTVGVIVDERASAEQRDAIVAIASGSTGGPMSALSGLVGSFAGVESSAIQFQRDGVKWSVRAGSFVYMAAEGAMCVNPQNTSPMQLTNTGHPASDTLALCHASTSHANALGFRWNDDSGRNNGHYAPFAWQSA
jgi:hypothetical protein